MPTAIYEPSHSDWTADSGSSVTVENATELIWEYHFQPAISLSTTATYFIRETHVSDPFTPWTEESVEWTQNAFDAVSDPWPEY